MQDLIGLMGYVLALVATAVAWFFWRRTAELESQNEIERRGHDESMLATKDLRNELDAFKERLEKSQIEVRKLKEQVAREKQEAKSLVSERAGTLQSLEELKAKAERRAEHFESQCATLLQQIRTAETTRADAERRSQELLRETESKISAAREAADGRAAHLSEELRSLRSEYEQLRKQAEQMQEQLKIANPEDIKRHRRKIANLEHLLMSMRGLKEMAEERSQNWEIALRILSRAVLMERSSPGANEEKLGVLVAAALEAVGHQLVQDEWSQPSAGPEAAAVKSESNNALT